MTSETDLQPPPTMKEVRDKAQSYFVSYKRHATAVALMWGIFTCGFVVLNVIVFIQPQWIGRFDSQYSAFSTPGYIGLYERCELTDQGSNLLCSGQFNNWATINHPAFRASTFFIGVSCLIIWICIALFFLFFVIKPFLVFSICGALQFVSAIFMFLGCIIFPAGWNDPDVLKICGSDSDQYVIAGCKVGWAYILAMVGIFDALFLAVLAFVLAARQTEWSEELFQLDSASDNKYDGYIDETTSVKPSMFISPVFLSPDEEPGGGSEYSHGTKRSKSDFTL